MPFSPSSRSTHPIGCWISAIGFVLFSAIVLVVTVVLILSTPSPQPENRLAQAPESLAPTSIPNSSTHPPASQLLDAPDLSTPIEPATEDLAAASESTSETSDESASPATTISNATPESQQADALRARTEDSPALSMLQSTSEPMIEVSLTDAEMPTQFDLESSLPATYQYSMVMTINDRIYKRLALLKFDQVEEEDVSRGINGLRQMAADLSGADYRFVSFLDEPYLNFDPMIELGAMGTSTTNGTLIVSDAGEALMVSGTSFMAHLIPAPHLLPFGNLSEFRPTNPSTRICYAPLLMPRDRSTVTEAQFALRPEDSISLRLGQLSPSDAAQTLQAYGLQCGAYTDYWSLLRSTERYVLRKRERLYRDSINTRSNLVASMSDIICFDRVQNRIVYRRVYGEIQKGDGRYPDETEFDIELFLQTQDPQCLRAILDSMGANLPLVRYNPESCELPVTRLLSLGLGNTRTRVSLSPDGRWLTEDKGNGLRIRDLDTPQADVVCWLRGEDGRVFWDHDSQGFVRVIENGNRPPLQLVECIRLLPDDRWESQITGFTSDQVQMPIDAAAVSFSHNQILTFNSRSIRAYDLSNPLPIWQHESRQNYVPTSAQWLGDHIYIDFPDKLLAMNCTDGSTEIRLQLTPGRPPDASLSRRSYWVPRFDPSSNLLWTQSQSGFTAHDLNDGSSLGHIDIDGRPTQFAVASKAKLLFALEHNHKFSIYDLNDLTLMKKVSSLGLPLISSDFQVSSDARRMLVRNPSQGSPYLLFDIDWLQAAPTSNQ